MAVYYNEIEPYAAAWLRSLISSGLIPDGEVDERSILDVSADDLKGFRQCHFFTGIGGWPYALRLAGWDDDRECWTGSAPCQPISVAGKQKGADDDRHLWPAFYRLISERRPAVVFGEQVAGALGREWLSGVRADLEDAGYACGAADLCAASVGAPHIRQRLYWVASDTMRVGVEGRREAGGAGEMRQRRQSGALDLLALLDSPFDAGGCHPQPLIRRVDDDVSSRVGRLRAYGNAIVPALAAQFVGAFMEAC
jgi:DNA (cytosine-5)-methyltransferase 1